MYPAYITPPASAFANPQSIAIMNHQDLSPLTAPVVMRTPPHQPRPHSYVPTTPPPPLHSPVAMNHLHNPEIYRGGANVDAVLPRNTLVKIVGNQRTKW